jgi:hypothetical protein
MTAAFTGGWAAVASAQRLDIRQATVEFIRKQVDTETTTSKGSQSSDVAWNKLRTLARGDKVQVDAMNGAEVKGRLQSVADDAITVTTDTGNLRILRADVWRVRVPNLGKRIAIGMTGFVAGFVSPTLVCPSCENEGHSTTKGRAILSGLGSLLFFAPQTSTIYKAHVK